MLQENSAQLVSNHQHMVETFTSDFYRNKRLELHEIVSPTFTYFTPFSGLLNFLEYVDWMENLATQRSVTKLCKPKSDDNSEYSYKYVMKIIDLKLSFEEELIGETIVIVVDGLIEHVENKYEEEISNPKLIKKITNILIN